jgi:2-polyprenyl-3-methyl-5-hydroxy-6-metoxy-1,4-benzoquinol methylase
MSVNPAAAVDLLGAEVEHHVLRLRELLVRWDENLKAWQLLNSVPYWATDRPAIVQARAEQREMVLHAIDPDAYQAYYAQNPHERPFEQQYGIEIEQADLIPRVAFLAEHLDGAKNLYDLGCNDAWMLEHLYQRGFKGRLDGIDLNRSNIALAKERQARAGWKGGFVLGDAFDVPEGAEQPDYDAVVMFEVLEHLPSPAAGLAAAASYVKPGGHLYVSTPLGAVEGGNLPTWAHVERKGHLHSFRPSDFYELLERVGEVVAFDTGPDRVMVAKVAIR